MLGEEHGAATKVAAGFDDDYDRPVAAVRFRARIASGGDLEVGTVGVGSWRVRVGDESAEYELNPSGHGFGEEMIAPPARTSVRALEPGTEIDATATLHKRPGLGAAGMFSIVARPAARPSDEVIAAAVDVARGADVAVVVVGLTEEQETESVDKSTLALPGSQDELVSAVAAAARRTVVVVNAATPILMPWLDQVDAVLWAGLPGPGGRARGRGRAARGRRAGRPAGHDVPGRGRRRAGVVGDAGGR